jgi:hypothetical protein
LAEIFGDSDGLRGIDSDNPNVRAVAEYWSVLDDEAVIKANADNHDKVANKLRSELFDWTEEQKQAIIRSTWRQPIPEGLFKRLQVTKSGKRSKSKTARQIVGAHAARMRYLNDQGLSEETIARYEDWYFQRKVAAGESVPTPGTTRTAEDELRELIGSTP